MSNVSLDVGNDQQAYQLDALPQRGVEFFQVALEQSDGTPELAGTDDTAPALDQYSSIGPADGQGAGTITYETRDGQSVLVSESVNPSLYHQVVSDGKTLSAIGSSELQGYDLADSEATGPSLQDYKAIGPADEVGPGLIRYETASGEKVIVSQATNPQLYDQVAADYDKLSTINQAEAQGYSLSGADDTPPGDIVLDSIEDLGNGIMQYETESGEKVVVSQDLNSTHYDQLSGLNAQKEDIGKSQDAGYKLADGDTVAPGLTEYKGIRPPDEDGPGLIRYTDASGEKVVVSQVTNPELYDQVVADYSRASAIKQSKDEGYLLSNDKFSQAPDFQKVGSPDEFGNGIIRFETASGDKFIVSQDINPQLYDAAVDAYNRFSEAG